MKVGFLANSAWYLSNFRVNSLAAFAKEGHEVECFVARGSGESDPLLAGVCVHTFPLNSVNVSWFRELLSLFHLYRVMRKSRPDVLFTFNPKTNLYGLIVCWALGIPCLPNVSGVGSASQLRGTTGMLYRLLTRTFFRTAQQVFFQNASDQQASVNLNLVSEDRTELLPGSGVDLSRFRPGLVSPHESFTFLLASRLIYPKGVLEYLKAAQLLLAKYPDCRFLLAGISDNSIRGVSLDQMKEYLGDSKVTFLGHVTDMPSLLSEVDCVVLPSYYPEGTPRSLLEAAAAGKIIVTTDTPGCSDVVLEGENGFLVQARSTESLMAGLEKVLSLPESGRSEMAVASRELAERKFDEALVIERYITAAKIAANGGDFRSSSGVKRVR